MKDKNRENPLRLMQTALTSLWCCAGWKFPSKLWIFSLPHHPPVGLHPSQGDKQNLFPAGTASYLWIYQVQSRSDWAVVRRSRWRIHRATIERFLSFPLFLFISLSPPLVFMMFLPYFCNWLECVHAFWRNRWRTRIRSFPVATWENSHWLRTLDKHLNGCTS